MKSRSLEALKKYLHVSYDTFSETTTLKRILSWSSLNKESIDSRSVVWQPWFLVLCWKIRNTQLVNSFLGSHARLKVSWIMVLRPHIPAILTVLNFWIFKHKYSEIYGALDASLNLSMQAFRYVELQHNKLCFKFSLQPKNTFKLM